ncbi:MAG: alkaline phosphatase PafA [Ferruginibacter sp.]
MRKKILITACLFITGVIDLSAQQKVNNTPAFNNGIERPKLVVGLVIDQMRWDYLYRYTNRYGNGGFKRLLQQGYSFENTFIPYTPAVTGPGHTCLYTGSVPAIHGIVGNDWIERDSGKIMYCAQDRSVNTVGSFSNQGQMSPKNMLVTTVGDELRMATNFRSRVYGVALKDRGGIMPAGHSANAAYWFDDSTGNWITSTYYMNNLPAWVSKYNNNRKVDSLMMKDWNLLYDLSTYEQSTADDKKYERPLFHETTVTFPHAYRSLIGKNYYPFRQSPYGNTLSFDFAKKLIQHEKLGMSAQADMLCLSLSSTDYVGHRFGPNSLETEDTYLRLDKDIEDFLNYLDATIGKGSYLLFLSADHGAPQVPDFMKENKLPGGSLYSFDLLTELNQLCVAKFGRNNLVKAIYEYQVYLDNSMIDSAKIDRNLVKNTVIQYLGTKPQVIKVFDYTEFNKVVMPASQKEMFAKGYYNKRSGDIQFILKPQYTDVFSVGTEHGTMYAYDTHIPLLWFGWKIKPGKTNREVYMTDVAPTISAMLKIQMPNGSVGHVLEELMK